MLVASAQPAVRLIDSGRIFHDPPFKSCHAATLAETGKDTLLYAWFGGDYEGAGNVAIWGCFRYTNQKEQWGPVFLLATGKDTAGRPLACWNPVLFRNSSGVLFLYYKVGRNPREWRGERKISRNGGKTWSSAVALPPPFLGPVRNKPVQLQNGTVLCPSSTEGQDEKSWKIHLESTDAAGNNRRYIPVACDSFDVIQPAILQYGGDTLQLLCRSRQKRIIETWSFDGGRSWSPLTALSLPNPNAGIDAVSLANGWQLLVYNPMLPGTNWWEGRSVLRAAVSTNGRTWSDLLSLEDHEEGEYSYPAVILDSRNIIRIAYTGNRTMIKFADLVIE